MFTAIAVLFQSAPIFLPGIGLALSPLSTLPIAIAAISNIFLGLLVFISSAFILSIVSIQETIIFLFTTGILGIMMGTLLYRKSIIITILFSSISLSFGMIFLTYIVGIPAFKELASSLSILLTLFIYFSFSLIYVSAWNIFLRKFVKYLLKFIRLC